MRTILIFLLIATSFEAMAQPAGDLDDSFDEDGIVLTSVSSSSDVASAVALQDDGKIVIAGHTTDLATGQDFVCIRYNNDGSLDETFGSSGIVTTDIQIGSDDVALTLKIQDDGKIVLGGYSDDGSQQDAALVRYHSDGTLDTSFGEDGIVLTDFENGNADEIRDLEINPLTGKINVGGASHIDSSLSKPVIARYESSGELDSTFDSNGIRLLWVTDLDDQYQFSVEDIAVKANGQVTAVGWRNFPSLDWDHDYWVCRVNSDGSMNESFSSNGDGVAVYNGGFNGSDQAFALALLPDNSFYMAGGGYVGSLNYSFTLFEMNADGTFGDLSATSSFGNAIPRDDIAYSMVVQNDGKLVLAGVSEGNSETDFAITRLNPGGTIDEDFGNGGQTQIAISNNDYSECFDMVIQDDNRIVMVGRSGDDIALVRLFGEEFIDLNAIELEHPENGATGYPIDLIQLDWDHVWGADSYEVEIDTEPDFTGNPQLYTASSAGFNWSENIQADTEYFWRVRATDGEEWGAYSDTWSFTTAGLEDFSLLDPPNNAEELNFAQLSFDWLELEGAHEYGFQIGTDVTFASEIELDTIVEFDNLTTENLLPGTVYFWRVRASDGFVWGEWVGPWSFTTAGLEDFVLLQPLDMAEEVDFGLVEFDWTEINAVNDYELELDSSETFSENPQIYNSTSSSLEVESLAPLTTYFWRVRASSSGITGEWSEVWEFTTSETTDISVVEKDNEVVSVYPNPSNGQFAIKSSANLLGSTYQLRNISGKVVKEGRIEGILQVIEVNVSSGSYWITILESDVDPIQLIIK